MKTKRTGTKGLIQIKRLLWFDTYYIIQIKRNYL